MGGMLGGSVTVSGEASFYCVYCTLCPVESLHKPLPSPPKNSKLKKTTCPVRHFDSLCVEQRRQKSLFSVGFYKYTSRMWPAPAKIPTGQ
jgi:hypothetical protein